VTDEHAKESSQQPTRETATGGASCVVLEYGWASPLLPLPPVGVMVWLARKLNQFRQHFKNRDQASHFG